LRPSVPERNRLIEALDNIGVVGGKRSSLLKGLFGMTLPTGLGIDLPEEPLQPRIPRRTGSLREGDP